MGTLYLVSTPIGNLEDLSPRALRILQEVRLIAAEDTRVTRKLLAHFGVHTPLTSYFEHNKLAKLDTVLASLVGGDVALVSDAGTPALNDPGYELVQAALEIGHTVCPVPGPSAPIAALVASGLPTDAFLFLGYLPRKPAERRTLLEQVAGYPFTLIFLEAPHRLVEALADLQSALGDREIAAARELTKVHEEIWRGNLTEARQYFDGKTPRGEFTLVVAGNPQERTARCRKST
jgi:16S rRNA (cytidine1402-2'-O)-methyltransferase